MFLPFVFPCSLSALGAVSSPSQQLARPVCHPVRSAILVATVILVDSPSPRHHPDYHLCDLTNWPWLHNPWLWAQISLNPQKISTVLPNPTANHLVTSAPQWLWRLMWRHSWAAGEWHGVPRGGVGVGNGRGVLCVCVHGFVLQVSGSPQKFLPVSKVSKILV